MSSANTTEAKSKRFELPQLSFNFSSLTEGTNIPPPPESPVQTPPKTPPTAETKKTEATTAAATTTLNGVEDTSNKQAVSNGSPTTTTTAGTKRPADDTPLSPAASSRAGSIRRLFSRNLLNNAYAEGEAAQQQSQSNGGAPAARPMSRSNGSILDEKKAKRGSGFFRRLRSNDPSRRSSVVYDSANNQSKPEVRGPPPPMIPELSALESKVDINDGGSLGSDLFKNI